MEKSEAAAPEAQPATEQAQPTQAEQAEQALKPPERKVYYADEVREVKVNGKVHKVPYEKLVEHYGPKAFGIEATRSAELEEYKARVQEYDSLLSDLGVKGYGAIAERIGEEQAIALALKYLKPKLEEEALPEPERKLRAAEAKAQQLEAALKAREEAEKAAQMEQQVARERTVLVATIEEALQLAEMPNTPAYQGLLAEQMLTYYNDMHEFPEPRIVAEELRRAEAERIATRKAAEIASLAPEGYLADLDVATLERLLGANKLAEIRKTQVGKLGARPDDQPAVPARDPGPGPQSQKEYDERLRKLTAEGRKKMIDLF